MKKYLLLIPFLLGSVYAGDPLVYDNPLITDIAVTPASTSQNSYLFGQKNTSPLYKNTTEAYCRIRTGFPSSLPIDSVESTTNAPANYANQTNPPSWFFYTASRKYMTQITCSNPSGCMDPDSANYDDTATVDSGTCDVCSASNIDGCSESACSQYGQWNTSQSLCMPNQLGCSDPTAENYNPSANVGSDQNYCIYCAVSTPHNCTTQSSCSLVGGGWNTSTLQCEDLVGSTPISVGDISIGEIGLAPPTGATSPIPTTTPPASSSVFTAQCSSYDSNNVCVAYDYFVENTFFEFLNDTVFTSLVRVFFFSVLFTVFIWIFRFITRLF